MVRSRVLVDLPMQSNGNLAIHLVLKGMVTWLTRHKCVLLGVSFGVGNPPPQKKRLGYSSYYSKKFTLELMGKTVLCECMNKDVCCDMLLKQLYMISEDFFKALYLILFWQLQELMINFAPNFLYKEMMPLTFPSIKYLTLQVYKMNGHIMWFQVGMTKDKKEKKIQSIIHQTCALCCVLTFW